MVGNTNLKNAQVAGPSNPSDIGDRKPLSGGHLQYANSMSPNHKMEGTRRNATRKIQPKAGRFWVEENYWQWHNNNTVNRPVKGFCEQQRKSPTCSGWSTLLGQNFDTFPKCCRLIILTYVSIIICQEEQCTCRYVWGHGWHNQLDAMYTARAISKEGCVNSLRCTDAEELAWAKAQ